MSVNQRIKIDGKLVVYQNSKYISDIRMQWEITKHKWDSNKSSEKESLSYNQLIIYIKIVLLSIEFIIRENVYITKS